MPGMFVSSVVYASTSTIRNITAENIHESESHISPTAAAPASSISTNKYAISTAPPLGVPIAPSPDSSFTNVKFDQLSKGVSWNIPIPADHKGKVSVMSISRNAAGPLLPLKFVMPRQNAPASCPIAAAVAVSPTRTPALAVIAPAFRANSNPIRYSPSRPVIRYALSFVANASASKPAAM